MSKIKLKPLAEADLDNIWDFIANDNPDKAEEILWLINEKLHLLAGNHNLGRARLEILQSIRSFPIKSYIVFYRPIKSGIEVIRILHSSQDIISNFSQDE